ncbi:unnamed protein product [Adineta ricciae]|uniref:Uncharacterized protein n=1 Tax=Adineta ricciae TaxID=249248 RepID=A0A814Y188_ADIRI|nr:unnamed protein product [Adineta ricciae]CAF1226497.1 unnamed protein product [Adineta ricciae]
MDHYTNCNLKPTQVTDSFWLSEYNEVIASNSTFPDGKWMQFYDLSELDTMWERAKYKYRAGHLIGIHSIKVSTARPQPRASNSSQGVIIFYCGPANNESIIMHIGEKLLQEMPYKSWSGHMSYKSDEQTSAGTRATGQIRNHLYRIPCGKT